jgi:hypothetical protein
MADDPPIEPPPPPPDASLEEVLAFFGRVGVSDECPICKTRRWAFPERDRGGVLRLPNPISSGQILSVPAYMLVCENCQFVRLHAKRPIDEEIAALKKEGG